MKLFTTLILLIFTSVGILAQDISWSSNRPQNTLIEGCGKGEFKLTNEDDQSVDVSIDLSGNFSEEDIGTDVLSTVQIQPGKSYIFFIEALEDNLVETGEYISITVSSGNNVLHEHTLQLQDELKLSASHESDFKACPGDEVLLTASSNGNVTWMPGNVISDTLLLPFRTATDVVLTAHQGSCMESIEFKVEPTVDVSIDHEGPTLFLCKGDDPTLVTATLENTASVKWSSEGFLFSQEPNNAIKINPKTSGKLYATVSANNCTVTDTLLVRVDSLPLIEFDTVPNKDPYCPGEIVTIYGMKLQQDRFPDATYEWEPETGVLSDVKKANLTITTTDTITYIRTTKNNACKSTDSITLNVDNPPIVLNFTDTLICPNQTVEIELKNPEQFKSYEWGPEEEVSCTECVKTKASPAESTTITLQLETEHCPTSASVFLNIKPPRPITIEGKSPVCPGEEVQLIALESNEYKSFEWSGSVDFSCKDCPDPIISSNGINSATLVAVDAEGCLGTGNFVYDVYRLPEVSIGIEPAEVAQGETITATLITSETENFTDIIWQVNGNRTEQTEMVADLVMTSEENIIQVTARTEDGCLVTATITVKADPPSYRIPNAFTPNGNANNIFRVVTKGNITVDRMRIFTRWSQLIYTDQSGKGWDGRQSGKNMPSDTYVYIIEMTLPDGKKIEKTSEVTLIN